MRALIACIALTLVTGCDMREASAPSYICNRTQVSQPFECLPQGAPPPRETATAPKGEVRLVTPNGAVTGETTVIKPPESVVVIPALPTQ